MALIDAFQTLVDFEVGVTIRDFKSDESKKIFLAVKTLTAIIGAAHDLEVDGLSDKPQYAIKKKMLIIKARTIVTELNSKVNMLRERSPDISQMQAAISDTLVIINTVAKQLKK